MNQSDFRSRFDRLAAFVVVPLALIALNAILLWPIFVGELSQFIASIEVGYIQAGKFLAEFSSHTWNPLWYNGFPFHVMYNPIPPYLEWVVHALTGLPMGQVYRILTGLALILTPVAVAFFSRKLTGRTSLGFLAGLAWSILPSFGYLVFSTIASDASHLANAPWQVIVLLEYGEGTHILGLLLVPLAGLTLLRAFERPVTGRILLAAVSLALVALTSMIALLASLFLFGIIAISEGLLASRRKHRPGRTFLLLGFLFLGFIAFWFNAQFLGTSFGFGSGELILKTYGQYALYFPVVLAVIFAILFLLFRGHERRQPLLVSTLWFLALFAIVFFWERYRVALAPQPIRYLAEVNLAAILLAVTIFGFGLKFLGRWRVAARVTEGALVTLLGLVIILSSRSYLTDSHRVVAARTTPVTDSREYRLSRTIENLPGAERVFATGNDAFSLNLFTSVPQLRGGLDQAATNEWWNHASFQILTGSELPATDALVRAMNLNYVVVTTGASANPYKDYWHPEKFASWEKVSEAEGDIIYRAPLEQASLAQIVSASRYQGLEEPRNALDLPRLVAYADWVDRRARPVSNLRWGDNGRITLEVDPRSDELISVQVTYDRGWKATSGDGRLKIERDVLDNLVIVPRRAGPQKIVVEYHKPWDVWVGYGITVLTLLALGLYPRFLRPRVERVRTRIAEQERELARLHEAELRKLGIKRTGGSAHEKRSHGQ